MSSQEAESQGVSQQNEGSLIWAKAFYFCFFAAAAALLPFLALYYDSLGLSGRQIGLLVGLPPLISLVGAPLWGAVADASRRHKTILTVAITGAIALALTINQTKVFMLLIPAVIVYAFFAAPIIPLTDNAVIELLGDRKERYGRQRIWGAVGWGLSAPAIGQLIEIYGLHWSFWGYAGIMLAVLMTARQIPYRLGSTPAPFWQGARTLLSNRPWLLFLFLVFAGGMGQAAIHNFLFLYLDDLGASKTLMGLALTVATLSELPMFFYADRLLARWSARGLFIFGTFICVIRALILSFAVAPWMVLGSQLLHGLTFSGMWVAGVSYASESAPPGLGATAQGLFSGVMMGVAALAGALIGGALYQDFGGAQMYRIMAFVVLASVLLFLLASRRSGRQTPAPTPVD